MSVTVTSGNYIGDRRGIISLLSQFYQYIQAVGPIYVSEKVEEGRTDFKEFQDDINWESMFNEMWIKDIDRIKDDKYNIFIAKIDGECIVGSGFIHEYDNDVAEIKRVCVRDGFRGKGIGKKLVLRLIEESKREYNKIILNTSPKQKRAYNLYKSLGFTEIDPYGDEIPELFHDDWYFMEYQFEEI